jgi:hypothetical protein
MKIPACEPVSAHLEGDMSFCTLKAFLEYGESISMTEAEFKDKCVSPGEHILPDWE